MEIVCRQWTEYFEVYGYLIEDILTLIQEAYRERAKEGISFDTLNYTIKDFLAERTENDYWFLAFDSEHRILYGTARLTIKDRCGEICNFAVSPQSQGKHVGTQLLKSANRFAKEQGLEYVISFTAIKAESSVKCHTHNGFMIVGINANLLKEYSSYVFRNQLVPSTWWNSILLIKLSYYKSYIKYKLVKKKNGKITMLGRFVVYLKKITR